MNLYLMAQTYGKLPSEILQECSLEDYNFNMHVTRVGAQDAVKRRTADQGTRPPTPRRK